MQDLTPQLRTRLSRVERAVGWFVLLATLLLLAGFAYYVYHTAERKGWFKTKVPYFTYVRDATGLKVGDKVRLMGFDVGEITWIAGTEAGKNWFTQNNYNVYVAFEILEPYYGYIWTDSMVRIGTGDFLGKRVLEVMKGSTGDPTANVSKHILVLNEAWRKIGLDYVPLATQPKGHWLESIEAPALTGQLDQLAQKVGAALPGILSLTNQIHAALSNTVELTVNLNAAVTRAQPVLTNLAVVTAALTNGPGALGEWLFPTNLNARLDQTLAAAHSALGTADTNLAALAVSLGRTLGNMANLTSNLNVQVKANDQLLTQISRAVTQADELMQGLRRHWLLRSAFKEKPTNQVRAPARRGRSR